MPQKLRTTYHSPLSNSHSWRLSRNGDSSSQQAGMVKAIELKERTLLIWSQLTREYQTIQENPPPYIVAHPSESNILE